MIRDLGVFPPHFARMAELCELEFTRYNFFRPSGGRSH